MRLVLIGPRKYVQGNGVLREAGQYIGMLGKKPVLLWGPRTKAATQEVLLPSLKEAGLQYVEVGFRGECTREEAARLAQVARDQGADVIVGLGGGKALDTAKGSREITGLPLMTVPTIASNDAPTSAVTVWYNDQGDCLGFDCWRFNPDIVLVDTGVIARAPVRYLVAGIGDALATWLEANASFKARSQTVAGGLPTMAALALAKLCYDTLLEFGVEAKSAVEQQVVTPAVEKVVEANILLSGLGFESGGLASAHSIANDLPFFHETHGFLHGEKVAFGIISQLCLEEDLDAAEIYRVVDFMIDVGLPVTFADLNMAGVTRDRLIAFGEVAAKEGALAHNHNFKVTAESIAEAMIAADALGRRRKEFKGR